MRCGGEDPGAWRRDRVCDVVPNLDFLVYFLKTANGVFVRARDLLIFAPFLAVFLLTLVYDRDISSAHHHVQAVSDALVWEWDSGPRPASEAVLPHIYMGQAFDDIQREEHIWRWLLGSRGPGQVLRDGRVRQNIVLGVVRLSQNRVVSDSYADVWTAGRPTLHGNYSGWSMPTPGFAPESESREPMRHDAPCGVDGVGRTGWTFTKVSTDADQPAVVSLGAEAPGGVDVVVEGIAATYPVHGFMFDLPVGWNRSRYTDFVQCLRTHRWIDSNTRMVQVHLFTYNPNSNYFVQCRLFVEITAGGKLIPRAQVVPFKYERFRGAYAVFQVILNVFVAMYVVKLLADIASNVSRTGRAFLWLFSVWRLLEGFNLSIFCLSFYWKVFFWVRPFPDNDFNDPSVLSAQLADLGSFQYTLHTLTMLNALNAMLSCLKIFRFFGVHPSLKLLTETLKGVATPLLCLGAYCVTIVTAFSIAGVLIFGIHTKEYRTFANAFRTLLLALLGDFDFGELRKVDDTAAVLFFFPYMLLTWLIILNMVIAIINGGFTMAKVIQNQVGGEVDLAPKLREAWISIEQSVCCARKADGRPAVHAGPLQFNSIEGASTASIEHAIRPLLQPEVWLRAHGLGSDAVIPARAALCCTRQALAAQLAERFEAEQADRIAQGLCWLMSEGDDGSVDNRCNPEVYPALVNYRAMASVVGGGYRRKYLEQHGYGWGDDEMSASHHSSKAGARTASASGSGSGTPESMSVEDLPALAGTIPTEALLEKAVMRRQALIDALVAARARRRVSVAAEGRLGAMQR